MCSYEAIEQVVNYVPVTEKVFLSAGDCSQLFGLGAGFWLKLAEKHEVPSYRLGKTVAGVLFKRREVEAYIARRPNQGRRTETLKNSIYD